LTLAYIGILYVGARPLIRTLVRRYDGRGATQGVMAVACIAILLSSLVTQCIGVHAIFGSFILGAIVPHDSRIARELAGRIGDLVSVLFLPAFFAFAGMHTQIGLLSGASSWLACGLIIAVATAGKFGGSFLAARLTGLGVGESAALGTLLNTRGLMELIVLNIGLDLRILSSALFAMMVVMTVVTTLATSPILRFLGVERIRNRSPAFAGAAQAAPH
jgi:Kef-type K+ transport system membrane component KefB